MARRELSIPKKEDLPVQHVLLRLWGNGLTSPRLWQAYSNQTPTTMHHSTLAHGDRSVEVSLYGV
jgi:hypothetical protein